MDDNELYAIGDVARRTGLSVSAIRFYSDAGVITPTGHTDAGYRLYDIQAIARLELVRTLRELDTDLDDIRRLLAGETTLRDLGMAHLALVERQMVRLQARRAVLRTIVKRHTATEQVSLMHKLVSMSDDDRDRLIDEFWNEISDSPDVHPYVKGMRECRPVLPEEPTTEQLEAWIELADLVQDDDFRHSIRELFHKGFHTAEALLARERDLATPQMREREAKRMLIYLDAGDAQRAGLPADTPHAQDIVNRLVAATAEVTGEHATEVRRRLAANDHTSRNHQPAAQAPDSWTSWTDICHWCSRSTGHQYQPRRGRRRPMNGSPRLSTLPALPAGPQRSACPLAGGVRGLDRPDRGPFRTG
ncbi:helix-turn-helix domain-containing protein [Streptomyces bluensis]|uniref:MerR family transcriptional regulator n=1 Tax=Streptomyces bluensis TaxID=33897 RepID=A0ABW6UHX7_9ACTN